VNYLYGFLAALALAVVTGLYGFHVGDKAGSNRIQVAWDADKAAITAEAIRAQAAADERLQAAEHQNQELLSEYQDKVTAANTASADLAIRLRHALGAPAHCDSLPASGSVPGTAPAGPSESDIRLGQLLGIVAELRTEAALNADELDTLSAEVKPQL